MNKDLMHFILKTTKKSYKEIFTNTLRKVKVTSSLFFSFLVIYCNNKKNSKKKV